MNPKHPPDPPMDLANMRRQGVRHHEINHLAESANFLAAYEAGDEQALWQAIVYCAGHHIPLGNERSSKHLTDVAVHVAHAVLFWDVGEIARPGNAAGTFEFRERDRRIAADVAVGRVIDDEVEVRPVLRRLPDIRDEDAA